MKRDALRERRLLRGPFGEVDQHLGRAALVGQGLPDRVVAEPLEARLGVRANRRDVVLEQFDEQLNQDATRDRKRTFCGRRSNVLGRGSATNRRDDRVLGRRAQACSSTPAGLFRDVCCACQYVQPQ